MKLLVTLAWNNAREVNPKVKGNLWLVNLCVNLHVE